jgi:hypothetical protein
MWLFIVVVGGEAVLDENQENTKHFSFKIVFGNPN